VVRPARPQAGAAWRTKQSLLATNHALKSPSRRAGDQSDEKNVIVRGALKKEPYHDAIYHDGAVKTKYFAEAKRLFKANADRLPTDNTRPPKIIRVVPSSSSSAVVTTDFFGFDTSDNHYGLRNLGDVSEMGDAILGKVAAKMGTAAPKWVAVRNVSDPQIKAAGLTLKEQAQLAASIYKGYGRWSSVCSGIVCWALIAAT
jgi:hypothetical protein